MMRARDAEALTSWLTDIGGRLLRSLGTGISADFAAVKPAQIEPWSNGQTERQITRLKLVKRHIHGRAPLDLLRARFLVAA